jgi:hypothetical protein
MPWIYAARDRYAVPGIVSLLIAAMIAAPLQSVLVDLIPAAAPMAGTVLRLMLAALCFAACSVLWVRWRSRRPGLAVIRGGRAP